jgi:GNAT superfamily N-acetyltransferase
MKLATLRDYPIILAMIRLNKNLLAPCPSHEKILSSLRHKQIVYEHGVAILFKLRKTAFKMAEFTIPPCTEIQIIVSRYQRRGYAKQMLSEFLETYNIVYLNVFANNLPANKLYQSLNMTLIGSHVWKVGEVNYYVHKQV